MIRKPFSDIEKIIVDAASSSEPPFDEASWKKMEILLDNEKRKRRPVIFWLLLLAGLTTAGYLSWMFVDLKNESPVIVSQNLNEAVSHQRNLSSNTDTIVVNQNETDRPINRKKEKLMLGKATIKKDAVRIAGSDADDASNTKPSAMFKKSADAFQSPQIPGARSSRIPGLLRFPKKKITVINPRLETKNSLHGFKQSQIAISNSEPKPDTGLSFVSPATPISSDLNTDSIKTAVAGNENAGDLTSRINPDSDVMGNVSNNPHGIKRNLRSRIFFTPNIGIENSGLNLSHGDKTSAKIGIGVGYKFNNHLSLQLSINQSKKKYSAAGSYYKTTPGTYWSMVDIQNIDANCLVYEFPIMLQYEFMPNKKLRYTAGVGLSSYVMQKEEYHYYYLRNGNPYNASTSYRGNRHFLSESRFSAGILYELNTRLMLTATGAVNLPLKGVGEGDIKLYSKDFLLGLKYFPFQRK